MACSSPQQRCITYRTMPEAGRQDVQGALLRLLYPSGDILLVKCELKADAVLLLGTMASGVPSSDIYRSCRVPDPNTEVQAESLTRGVKLYMTYRGKNTSETYIVIGILRPSKHDPVSSNAVGSAPSPEHPMAASSRLPLKDQTSPATAKASDDLTAPLIAPASSSSKSMVPEKSRLNIASDPDGADISVNGKFVGNSPLVIEVTPGDEVITVSKPGYEVWTRRVTVTSETVNVDARLSECWRWPCQGS